MIPESGTLSKNDQHLMGWIFICCVVLSLENDIKQNYRWNYTILLCWKSILRQAPKNNNYIDGDEYSASIKIGPMIELAMTNEYSSSSLIKSKSSVKNSLKFRVISFQTVRISHRVNICTYDEHFFKICLTIKPWNNASE